MQQNLVYWSTLIKQFILFEDRWFKMVSYIYPLKFPMTDNRQYLHDDCYSFASVCLFLHPPV